MPSLGVGKRRIAVAGLMAVDAAVPVRPLALLPPGRYPVRRGSEFLGLQGLQGVGIRTEFWRVWGADLGGRI